MVTINEGATTSWIELMALSEARKRVNPENPKAHDLERIMASIEKFGFVVPPTLDERSGQFVAGHGRIEALEGLYERSRVKVPKGLSVGKGGEWLLPVLRGISFDTTAERDAYLIADNRLTELGGWNDESLTRMLEGLYGADADLLEIAGYSEREFNRLMDVYAPRQGLETGPPTMDQGPAIRAKWAVEVGDIWRIPSEGGGDHWLLCGDCTDAALVGRLFSDGVRASLGFTSPPYNIGADAEVSAHAEKRARRPKSAGTRYAGAEDQADHLSGELYQQLLSRSTVEALKVCRTYIVNLQSVASNKVEIVRWLAEFEAHFVDVVIWSKTSASPAIAEHVLTSAFEFLYILSREQWPSRAIPTAQWQRGLLRNVYSGAGNQQNPYPELHSATFPPHLVEWVLSNFCERGTVVYDPFGGTGTTLVGAEQSGRLCRMIDLDPLYCAVTLDRISNLGLAPERISS